MQFGCFGFCFGECITPQVVEEVHHGGGILCHCIVQYKVGVTKKPEFAVAAKGLRHEIRHYLGLQDVTNVRVLIRYDAENISEETFEKACNGVFAEPPVDFLYKEEFPKNETDKCFSVEFLPGQFDQRADSAEQCIRFIKEDETPVIRTAVTYVIEGGVSDEELQAIKNHCINPVDSREAAAEKPETGRNGWKQS